MKIRTLLLILAFILAAIPTLLAKTVTKEQARIVARNFFAERISCKQFKSWNVNNLSISDVTTYEADGQPAVYVFSNNGQGFILVSADDALTPVLGYSNESNFSAPGTNPNFEYLISEYIAQIKYARSNSIAASSDVQNVWDTYSSSQAYKSVLADTVTVGPLVTTMWNQDNFYNELCPADAAGPNGHVYTGCVATAMSMIMGYYKYPLTGSGQHSYYATGYGTQTANYGATTYDWDAMLNSVNSSSGQGILANAQLQYHAGVSVNMAYAPDGSGAQSSSVPNALKTYFKYSPAIQLVQRSSYTLTNWENLMTEQLDANRPMYYSGKDPTADAGHAWVCDGYQKIGSAKTFHFNFGWGGAENGYYTTTALNGFTSQQTLIRNIYPNTGYPYGCSSKTLTESKGGIEDGSGPLALYDNNLSCTWLIAPTDTVNAITASFMRFDVSSSDTLYFYDGEDASAPLLAAYSGNTVPANVTSTGDRMFIRFITNSTVQDTGWLIEYSSAMPNLCTGTKLMTEPSGSFTDGSGPYDYKNNSLCKFKIQPPYAMNLTLTFDEFDLIDGDNIMVYALSNNDLIATLEGSQIPDPITVPLDGLYLIFKSDYLYTGTGFKASYSVGNVGTNELPDVKSLNISPNPASDFLMVRAYNNKTQQMQLTLNDMTGKNLFNESFTAQKGNIERSVDVSNFKAGMYFLTLKSAEGKVTQKVVVN